MLEIRLYNAAGDRWRSLTSSATSTGKPTEAVWRLSRLRGFVEASFTLSGRAAAVEGLVIGRRVEFWDADAGVRLYRGYVQAIEPVGEGSVDAVTVSCVSASMLAARQVMQQRYRFLAGLDVSQAWLRSVQRWVAPHLSFAPTLAATNAGVDLDELDTFDRYAGDIWEDLDTTAGLGLSIGADVAGDGSDLLYCRPLDTSPTHTLSLPDPGRRVVSWKRASDGREISNVLYLRRPTQQPNLLPNGSFEQPAAPSEELANLLRHSSFETVAWYGPVGWTTGGSMTSQTRGYLDSSDCLTGDKIIRADSAGGYAYQTRLEGLPAGHTLRFVVFSRPEDAAHPATFRLRIRWDTGAGFPGAPGSGAADEVSHTHASGAWERYAHEATIPAGTVGYRVEIYVDTAAAGQGAIFDDAAAFDASVVYQSGWRLEPRGDAEVFSYDWAYEDAWHGAYSVRFGMRPGALDTDGEDIRLRPIEAVSIQPGRTYAFRFLLTCASPGAKYIRAGVIWFDASGAALTPPAAYTTEYTIPAPTTAFVWYDSAPTFAAPPDAATCLPYLSFRSTLTWQVDGCGLHLFEGALPLGQPYVEGGTVQEILASDDGALSVSPAVAASVADFGYLPQIETIDTVSTRSDALTYAETTLTARALPAASVDVTLTGWPEALRPGQVVRAIGAAAADILPEPLPIAEIRGRWSAGQPITLALTLGRDPNREAALIRRIARDAARRGLHDRVSIA